MSAYVQVAGYVYVDVVAAEVACAYLQSMDIPARLDRRDVGGMYPHLGYGEGIRVLVPEALAQRAQELLAAMELEVDELPATEDS